MPDFDFSDFVGPMEEAASSGSDVIPGLAEYLTSGSGDTFAGLSDLFSGAYDGGNGYEDLGGFSAPSVGPPELPFMGANAESAPTNAFNFTGAATEPGASLDTSTSKGVLSNPSLMSQVMQGLGLKSDISQPKNMDAWVRTLIGGANIVNALLGGNKPKGYKSAAEMREGVRSNSAFNTFSPTQQQWADKYFYNSTPAGVARPRMPAAGMANGQFIGATQRPGMKRGGALSVLSEGGSPSGYIDAHTGGQDDVVPINAAGGEYMFDADTVSALGDGNNAAGAAKLDAFRQNIREHKRSAPADSIPPRARSIQSYMPKGALSSLKGR